MSEATYTGQATKNSNGNSSRFLIFLSIFFCSTWSILISSTLFAAEAGHEDLTAKSHTCFQKIGSQVYVEGATFVMGGMTTPIVRKVLHMR